jgi:hypothetical protein
LSFYQQAYPTFETNYFGTMKLTTAMLPFLRLVAIYQGGLLLVSLLTSQAGSFPAHRKCGFTGLTFFSYFKIVIKRILGGTFENLKI